MHSLHLIAQIRIATPQRRLRGKLRGKLDDGGEMCDDDHVAHAQVGTQGGSELISDPPPLDCPYRLPVLSKLSHFSAATLHTSMWTVLGEQGWVFFGERLRCLRAGFTMTALAECTPS